VVHVWHARFSLLGRFILWSSKLWHRIVL
jgi:hypothetical protein